MVGDYRYQYGKIINVCAEMVASYENHRKT